MAGPDKTTHPPSFRLIEHVENGRKEEAQLIAEEGIRWGREFLACGEANLRGFAPANITPYAHDLMSHCASQVAQYGHTKDYDGQALERLNNEWKKGVT